MSEFPPAADVDRAPGVSRRTLLKSAAWSAPVIAVALAVPAASASVLPIDPMDVTITVDKSGGEHGFTITNNSSQQVTALVTFVASAGSLLGEDGAHRNLISATDTSSAQYGESSFGGGSADPEPETYRNLWNEDFNYSEFRERRSGQATFMLAAGASYTFWQRGLSLFGRPRIVATVTSIAVGGGDLTAVAGDTKVLVLP